MLLKFNQFIRILRVCIIKTVEDFWGTFHMKKSFMLSGAAVFAAAFSMNPNLLMAKSPGDDLLCRPRSFGGTKALIVKKDAACTKKNKDGDPLAALQCVVTAECTPI